VEAGRDRKGFTLVEVMVASVLGGFIALVALGTLRTVTGTTERLDANCICAEELRFAADVMRADMMNLYRDTDADATKLVGVISETTGGFATDLTMRVVGAGPARPGQPEGDIYEVQYFLHKEEKDEKERTVLMRRLCPIVGMEDDIELQGGVLTVIAADIVAFDVQFFDGSEWQIQWEPEQSMLPELVEVSLMGRTSDDEKKARIMMQNFVVSFPRMGRQTRGTSDETAGGENE